MRQISPEKAQLIVRLRKLGKSLPEIVKETGFAQTTVTRYVSGVSIPEEYKQRLKEKQGGSIDRAKGLRENIFSEVINEIGTISERDKLFLLIGLYWGEGPKRDFEVINSDPALIQTLIDCFKYFGIRRERLTVALRVHSDISIIEAKNYWSTITGVPTKEIKRIEVIEGKKKGKLKHGMCRIRVRSGIRERLFIQTAIVIIGKESGKRVVSQ